MRKLFETPKRAIISMTVIFAVVMVVVISGVYGAISKQLNEIKNLQYNSIEQNQVAENDAVQQSQPEAAPVEPAPEVVTAEPAQEPETPVEQQIVEDASGSDADAPAEPAKKNKNKKKNQQSSGNQIVAQQPVVQQPQPNVNKKIGVKKAKSKALANAGVAKKNVVYTKTHLDYDDGVAIYDVEFYTNDYEYEYEIDAYSGKVREKNIEKNDRVYRPQNNSKPQSNNNQNNSKPQNNSNNNNSGSKNRISVDKAKSIALKHAGYSASKATFKKAKLDYDDGRAVYEIEFYVKNDEYNYEIDAKSGRIIDYDYEKNERYDDYYDEDWDD